MKWEEALLGVDTPFYRLEYRRFDGYLWSSMSYRGESYKVVSAQAVHGSNGINIVFDGTVVGVFSNGLWFYPDP